MHRAVHCELKSVNQILLRDFDPQIIASECKKNKCLDANNSATKPLRIFWVSVMNRASRDLSFDVSFNGFGGNF